MTAEIVPETLAFSDLSICEASANADQSNAFRTTRLLRMRASARGPENGASGSVSGFLEIHVWLKSASFGSEAAHARADKAAAGCVIPVSISTVLVLIGLIGIAVFNDLCDGLFDLDNPACFGSSVFAFPLVALPLVGIGFCGLWMSVLAYLRRADFANVETPVVIPEELWVRLRAFESAIEAAKKGEGAALAEHATVAASGAVASKVGNMLIGPTVGMVFKIAAQEVSSDTEARICAGLEAVRQQMMTVIMEFRVGG